VSVSVSNKVSGTFGTQKKDNVSFGKFSSLISRQYDSNAVSKDFFKTINKLNKKYHDNNFFDVLVFRDGKVVCGQIELNSLFKVKNGLDCDSKFIYENSTGTGAKLYQKLSEQVKLMSKKYKDQIKKDKISQN